MRRAYQSFQRLSLNQDEGVTVVVFFLENIVAKDKHKSLLYWAFPDISWFADGIRDKGLSRLRSSDVPNKQYGDNARKQKHMYGCFQLLRTW
jgi:hypothetical protein